MAGFQVTPDKNILRKLVFKGFWDIFEKHRLTYWLGKDSDSYFRFRGAFQTKSILAKKGEIRYQIGIEAERSVRTQTIVLFGKWKYSRKYGLSFEIEYKNGRRHAIRFGGNYDFAKDHRLEINIKSKTGKPLGVELILTRDFLSGNGQAFARLLKNPDESRIEAGMKLKW